MLKYYLITGGHHSSAIPLINILKATPNIKIKFLGHKYASVLNKYESSEYKEITSLNIPYIDLKSPKFYNVPGLGKYFKLLQSVFYCLALFIKERPYMVISYGGYLAVPVVLSAKILGIKCVTHEQTFTEGLANKVIAKLCNKVFVSWSENLKMNNNKYVFVGLPLRDEIKKVTKKKLASNYKVNRIFIQGGKQGSHILNEFIFNNLDKLSKKFEIYHQTSKHSINDDHIKGAELSKKYANYHAFEFIFGAEYTNILQNTDLILSRSGAHIVYEMSYINMPSIFVPIPWASQNEQYLNAKIAEKYTPSVILEEKDLTYENFEKSLNTLFDIIKSSKKYKQVEENSAQILAFEISKL